MRKLVTPLFAAFVLVSPLLAAQAAAEDWVVNKVSGKAWLVTGEGATRTPLTAGMTVPTGVTVQTSDNARAMLTRGNDAMVVGPKSALAMQSGWGAKTTTVLQRSGQITLEVETQGAPHFTVETPFMAAVVKGTRFDVRVSARDANVSVQRGRVQVADFASGQTADITPGQRAGVRAGRPGLSLGGRGQMPAIQAGQPRAAVVPAVGRADVVQPSAAAAATTSAASAGFGPGRSWSASAAVESKARGPAERARAGSASAFGEGAANTGVANAAGRGNGNAFGLGNGNGNGVGNNNAGGNGGGNNNAGGNGKGGGKGGRA